MGVLPSLALPPAQAAAYLLAYGCAAVIAMAGFGYALGLVGSRLRNPALRVMMLGAGLFAVGLGLFWMVSGWPGA
jgi:hypothetical protein